MKGAFLQALAGIVLSVALGAGSKPSESRARTGLSSDTAHCDSIVSAARVDSVEAGLFLTVGRLGTPFSADRRSAVTNMIANAFTVPRPLQLSVWEGPARMRSLRVRGADTVAEPRAPVIVGVYRYLSTRDSGLRAMEAWRTALMPGFDSAALVAIKEASFANEAVQPEEGEDSMRVEVRFSTDSIPGSRRIITAFLPRMPVVDAAPLPDNPAAPFPASELAPLCPALPADSRRCRDSSQVDEVVLRFVVTERGFPELGTVEIARATSLPFIRSAMTVLPEQRFTPARVRGCAIAQLIYYPFTFVQP